MAQNPYVNKVEYAGQTLMDLTNDTATPSDVLEGVTFHDRSGAPQQGSLGVFTGAGASTAGSAGLVPAPGAGDQGKILMGDGTWSGDIPDRLEAVENVYTDTNITIAISDWALDDGNYIYLWTNSLVTAGCGVEVFLQDGADSAGINGFDYDKVTGGVQFVTSEQPAGSLPIIIRIINTKADALISLDADDISSSAISGCDTVEEALESVGSAIEKIGNVPSGSTLQGEVNILNKKMPTGNAWDEILIPAGSNLNNYTEPGTYIVASDAVASQITNMPRAASGRLVVINRTDLSYKTQTYYPTSSEIIIYVRNYNNGTWTNWDRFALNSETEIKVFTPLSSDITVVSGTLHDTTLRIYYTSACVINVVGKLRLRDVPENTRPSLTISKPSDMPPNSSIEFVTSVTRRGTGDNDMRVCDGFTLSVVSSNIACNEFNFMSTALPAGWVELLF